MFSSALSDTELWAITTWWRSPLATPAAASPTGGRGGDLSAASSSCMPGSAEKRQTFVAGFQGFLGLRSHGGVCDTGALGHTSHEISLTCAVLPAWTVLGTVATFMPHWVRSSCVGDDCVHCGASSGSRVDIHARMVGGSRASLLQRMELYPVSIGWLLADKEIVLPVRPPARGQ